ncbi:putative arginyl-tRNA--protein transferase [Iodidimonas muriae]|uniref:Aspartate/glutamate leucyltransferase n=1 Tax=Iodidimonas muriae TaxID=261467 RepID=A0ABQ2LEW7_9PROT|nr:arginyltransferase [Iodidimonas muriae]GER07642.1 putative arginyl-tRNA--protein transferase [Kordiimonadales bacterium JCM 17843]GGO14508.1 putative arginyl-tRNA--protein transferase [Iodidimonas muriae]
MTDQSMQFPRFYVTASSPCPYLDGHEERKVFTELSGTNAHALNEALSRVGFRRSQSVVYRPACDHCNACISVRVVANAFLPSKSMRRTRNRNADLQMFEEPAKITDEQFQLLKTYLQDRHGDGGMASMDQQEFAEMVENSPIETMLVEYRLPPKADDPENTENRGQLVGVALTDILSDGLSMVYSFFNTDMARRSLGTFIILDHIQRAKRRGLRNVYLGYWIEKSPKMAYKCAFHPLEKLGAEGWKSM